MFTKLFWQDASERAISTFAQAIIAVVGVLVPAAASNTGADLVSSFGQVMSILPLIIGIALLAAFLSLLKAITAAYKANTDTASFTVDTKPLNKGNL
jgi:hypothetical protein